MRHRINYKKRKEINIREREERRKAERRGDLQRTGKKTDKWRAKNYMNSRNRERTITNNKTLGGKSRKFDIIWVYLHAFPRKPKIQNPMGVYFPAESKNNTHSSKKKQENTDLFNRTAGQIK